MKKIGFIVLVTLGIAILVRAGFAQSAETQSQPSSANQFQLPKAAADLFTEIADIDKLRILNPLGLTADEIQQLVTIIKSAQVKYNQKLVKLAVDPLEKLATQIHQTKQQALTGAPIPKDFDQQIKDLQSKFEKERTDLDNQTLTSLADQIHSVVTDKQFKMMVDQARKVEPNSKGTDQQYFNLFVREVFIRYPRIVTLLEQMHTVKTGAGQ
ncbi:MAG: hypothetical protein M1330_04895 [Armatimonadetes bacterium]|nr:hypothetical protein [Armatimonadota bacterium]